MSGTELQTIRVLAAVVVNNGRYLVCQRPPHKRHGGLWEFPGGKLEAGETLLMAAKRELREELDVEVTKVEPMAFSVADADSPFVIEFVPTSIAGTPVCQEHTALTWATLAELDELDLAPSDRQFVRFLLERR
jgi:8-oxo-dGTP diphosphatase